MLGIFLSLPRFLRRSPPDLSGGCDGNMKQNGINIWEGKYEFLRLWTLKVPFETSRNEKKMPTSNDIMRCAFFSLRHSLLFFFTSRWENFYLLLQVHVLRSGRQEKSFSLLETSGEDEIFLFHQLPPSLHCKLKPSERTMKNCHIEISLRLRLAASVLQHRK